MVQAIVRKALALSDPVPSFSSSEKSPSPASSPLDLRRRRVGVIHSLQYMPTGQLIQLCASQSYIACLNPLSLDSELSPAIAHVSMRAGVFLKP